MATSKIIYFDVDRNIKVTSNGSKDDSVVRISYQEKPVWQLYFGRMVSDTFTMLDLSDSDSWGAAIDTTFQSSSPMCRVLNADIDSTHKAEGYILLSLDADTTTFKSKIGSNEKTPAYFEVRGYDASAEKKYFAIFEVAAFNSVDPASGDPLDPESLYYDKPATDALLANKLNLVEGGTEDNLVSLTADGDMQDSGYAASDFAATSHTHTASQVTDFDTEVSNNTDVAANTAHRGTTTGNPHNVTKSDVGLGNVDNIADASQTSLGTVTSGGLGTGASLGQVTMSIGSDADGDMYYRASGKLTRLPKGTSLQVLRMNVGATAPEFAAATGDMLKATYDTNNDGSVNNADLAADINITALSAEASPSSGMKLVIDDSGTRKKIDWDDLPGSAGGEANTASNVGGATGEIYKQKSGVDLEMKTISGSGGTSITNNASTVDIASTRVGVYRNVYVDAGAMVPCTTNGASTGTNEYGSNDIDMDYFAFDGGATEERVQFKTVMPNAWDGGTVKAKFLWSSATGSTAGDTVEWGIKANAIGDSDVIDAALGTPQTRSDALTADNGTDLQISAATGAITIGGTPTSGDLVVFEVYRNTDGTDDMTEDAWLFGVDIQYKETTVEPTIW